VAAALIVFTVIMAASAMEVAGGINFLVRVAERIIRKNPKHITIIAPLVTYGFTFAAGTGHIVYPLLPVIYEVAHENGIRPERLMAIATIASQQAITASPVSAATAAMIGLLATHHIGLVQILIICVPSTLIAVFIASLVQLRVGKELKDDPEYQKQLASGEVELGSKGPHEASPTLCARQKHGNRRRDPPAPKSSPVRPLHRRHQWRQPIRRSEPGTCQYEPSRNPGCRLLRRWHVGHHASLTYRVC
jgi:anaerobic C4-dicarboxylate transporter DcuA